MYRVPGAPGPWCRVPGPPVYYSLLYIGMESRESWGHVSSPRASCIVFNAGYRYGVLGPGIESQGLLYIIHACCIYRYGVQGVLESCMESQGLLFVIHWCL